jgi:hypothetical protein
LRSGVNPLLSGASPVSRSCAKAFSPRSKYRPISGVFFIGLIRQTVGLQTPAWEDGLHEYPLRRLNYGRRRRSRWREPPARCPGGAELRPPCPTKREKEGAGGGAYSVSALQDRRSKIPRSLPFSRAILFAPALSMSILHRSLLHNLPRVG